MRGIYKLHGASQTAEARQNYHQLCEIARSVKRSTAIPSVRANAGWRSIDAAAKVGVERLLSEHPWLRAKLKAIYPGFIEE